jgi:hypothetical protein
MKRVMDMTTTTEREEANEYLDNMRRYENGEREDFEETLQELNDKDVIDVADDVIAEVANERAAFSAAQHMVHNPAGVGATSFFQNVIAMGSHRNGLSWSIPYNKDMRLHDASSQRSANTRINPQVARDVGGVDTSTSYSAPATFGNGHNTAGSLVPTPFGGSDNHNTGGFPGQVDGSAGFNAPFAAASGDYGDSMSGLSTATFEQQVQYAKDQSLLPVHMPGHQPARSNSVSPIPPPNFNAPPVSSTPKHQAPCPIQT